MNGAKHATQALNILAVDDNPTNIAIIEEMLGEACALTMANSGEQALDLLTELKPDVILLDVMMPGIDGYETCRQIRTNPAWRDVRIIMVSARAMESEQNVGYEAGADDYLTKPFAEEQLLAKLREHLGDRAESLLQTESESC